MAGIVMDTATFAHPNATPRTLAVVGGARRGRRAAVGHLAAALPLQARRPAAAVRPRPRTGSRRADGGRIVWSTLLDADLAATGAERAALGGHHRPPRPGRRRPRSRSCSRRPARRPGSASGRKPGGVDATVLTGRVRRRRPRPGGRRDGRRCRSPRRGRRSSPRPSGSPPRVRALTMAAPSLGPRARRHPRRRQAGRADLARRRRARPPAGGDEARRPRRDARPVRVAACCRSSSARRRGSSSTTSATARRYRATVCFGASSTTDDLEGELTPVDGPAPDARPRRGGARRRSRARSRSGRRPTARSRSAAAGPTRWPAPARRVELAPREVTIHALDARRPGTTRTRTGPIAIARRRVLRGHVRPGARPRPRRGARQRAPTSARCVRTARARSRSTTRSPLDDDPRGGRGGPGRACVPLLRPIDAGLERLPGGHARPRTRSRPSPAASSCGRRRAAGPGRALPARRDPDGALVAIASRRGDGRLAPDKVLRRRPASPRAVAPDGGLMHGRRRGRCARRRSTGPVFVVVGVFDGLHRGHAYLLEHLVARGRARATPGRPSSPSTTTPTRS